MGSQEDVDREFCEFFQNLFTSSSPSQNQIEEALKKLLPQVTPNMNDQLEEPFTLEDIENALSHMCLTKAPGQDGLPAVFFQKHWLSVRGGVINTCLHVLNKQGNLAPLNHTYIALIHEIEKPRKNLGKSLNSSRLVCVT